MQGVGMASLFISVSQMKLKLLAMVLLMSGTRCLAQTDDPVVMTINGKPVPRSEFEYSFRKNNSENVVDKKNVEEYTQLFVNYKLKVEAALDARLDTLSSFKHEFAGYRDQQIRPAMITDADIEAKARSIYEQTRQRIDGNGGMVKVAHILLMLKQKATPDEQKIAKQRIDSIYRALKGGADFATLARKYSNDPGSAAKGGELPWIVKGQTFKEFEDQAWQLKPGEISEPFLSPAGWHVVLVKGRQNFFSYESQRNDILKYIDQAGLRERIISAKLDTLAKEQHSTPEEVLAKKRGQMVEKDPNLKYLIQEYHDGLLLYEISNRVVWSKAQKDEEGLERFFKKHKKQYKWEQPRFKGIAYHTRELADVKAVQKALKGVDFDQWANRLRQTFNADSVLRIRVEKGLFKPGDNAVVDHEVFRMDTVAKPMKGYPYVAVYGKKLKKPRELDDVRSLVVADYQDELEKDWVEQLRRKYPVSVNREVLATVTLRPADK
jgi:peptidyl-prolyl cis-trans isomerase SurA